MPDEDYDIAVEMSQIIEVVLSGNRANDLLLILHDAKKIFQGRQ